MKTNLVNNIIEAMKVAIFSHSLDLLNTYPGDLLVHDRASLMTGAAEGATIAWVVGHSHTHLVHLGFNRKQNESVGYLTNLGSDDRFYVLKIGRDEKLTLREVERTAFAALSTTPILYERKGDVSAFWLYRGSSKLGYVALTRVGNPLQVAATITPVDGLSDHAKAALLIWCEQACVEMAHSLFVHTEVTWADPIKLALAA